MEREEREEREKTVEEQTLTMPSTKKNQPQPQPLTPPHPPPQFPNFTAKIGATLPAAAKKKKSKKSSKGKQGDGDAPNDSPPPPRTLAPIDVHFIHQRANRDRPAAPPPLPLLLLHGWPGSVVEFLAVIGPLADPGPENPTAQAFDVVAPSLPGFGFSEAPREAGWGLSAIASCFNTLMTKVLKYERYCVQGGDWGSMVARRMALDFGSVPAPPSALDTVKGFFSSEKLGSGGGSKGKERLMNVAAGPGEESSGENVGGGVVAIHQNMAVAAPRLSSPLTVLQALNAPLANVAPVFITKDEARGLRGLLIYQSRESGYFKIQSTKPMTLGYGLSDSPVAALAWVSVRKVWSKRETERGREESFWSVFFFFFFFSKPPLSQRISFFLLPLLNLSPSNQNENKKHKKNKKKQEKFHGWGDIGDAGRLKNPDDPTAPHHFERADILLNACLYWFGNRACSSVRIYKEVESAGEIKRLLSG